MAWIADNMFKDLKGALALSESHRESSLTLRARLLPPAGYTSDDTRR